MKAREFWLVKWHKDGICHSVLYLPPTPETKLFSVTHVREVLADESQAREFPVEVLEEGWVNSSFDSGESRSAYIEGGRQAWNLACETLAKEYPSGYKNADNAETIPDEVRKPAESVEAAPDGVPYSRNCYCYTDPMVGELQCHLCDERDAAISQLKESEGQLKEAAESVEAVPEWFPRYVQYHQQCLSMLNSKEMFERVPKLPKYQELRKEFEGLDVGSMLIDLVVKLSADSVTTNPSEPQAITLARLKRSLEQQKFLYDDRLRAWERIAELEAEVARLKQSEGM